MYTGEETFAEADAKYTVQLISEVSREYWTGTQGADVTIEKILEKINKHKERVRMEG
ncbi:hypothetical protein [Leuconostoc sp. MTCC 10508]|uniref:hypothetical protein n=1 Tax=Leuconostoc TaxID=1243 RepID=UPI0020BFFE7C|nr:hypothetical protein [Leuconostoc sp. MTCC 10508]